MLPTMLNVDVDLVVDNLCGSIFDVIDHDGHGICLFSFYLVDADVIDVVILLSN